MPPAPLLGGLAAHQVPTVPIIIVSDFNCPWCYVAHKEIQQALKRVRETHPNIHFTVEHRPFQLDPTLPTERPMCRVACYLAKFGDEKLKQISAALKERGKRVGIDFHMAGKTRQTTNAHRLALKAWLCGGEAAQTKMVDALFAAYFEKETDIGCYDFLSRAAESTGLMTCEQAHAFLESDKLRDEVQCLIRHSVLRGIKGVPFTIISNQWAVQGAETSDSFYKAFEFAANAAENVVTPSLHAAQVPSIPAAVMAPAHGVTGTAPSCKPQVTMDTASVSGDHASETATQSGTSAATTPINEVPVRPSLAV